MIIKVEYKIETVIVIDQIGGNNFEIHIILIQIIINNLFLNNC